MAIVGPMYMRWMFTYMALHWFYATHSKAGGVLAEPQSHSLRPRIYVATGVISSLLPHKEPKCQLRAGHAAASIAWLPLWSGGVLQNTTTRDWPLAFANGQVAKTINRFCFAVC